MTEARDRVWEYCSDSLVAGRDGTKINRTYYRCQQMGHLQIRKVIFDTAGHYWHQPNDSCIQLHEHQRWKAAKSLATSLVV